MGCASFNTWDALYITETSRERIVLEMRVMRLGRRVFTKIGQLAVDSKSIQELVAGRVDCRQISVFHRLTVLVNGQARDGMLEEVFTRGEPGRTTVGRQLVLVIGEKTFKSTVCNSLTEAMFSLDDELGSATKWWLKVCFDCRFSRDAGFVPHDDRDFLVCYRDFHDQLLQIEQTETSRDNSEFPPNVGDYFVNAFHTCPAWQERLPHDVQHESYS
jgi:hypothetical protein